MGLILKGVLAAFWLVLIPGLAGAAYFGWAVGKLPGKKGLGGVSKRSAETDIEGMSGPLDGADMHRTVGEYLLAGYVLLSLRFA